jgi:RNA polymerase sigma-70 factor (ECF subfamily)
LNQTSENELVQRAQAGDAQAFAKLVLAHQDYVYNLALRTLNDHQEAEDISQETFVHAWQALPRFRRQSKLSTWLYRIVTNLCYNRLPHLKRELSAIGEERIVDLPSSSLGDSYRDGDPISNLEAHERRAFLHQQIESLPDSYRLLITLRYQQGLPYAEIAKIVDQPLGTIKTGLFRAHQRLRKALEQYEEEPIWSR